MYREENVNARDLAYYMIRMFYETDRKYSCTRTKIGKLLSILSFKYATKGIILFDDPIYRYDDCGTHIKDVSVWLYRDEYLMDEYQDDKKYITDEFKRPKNLPNGQLKRYNALNNTLGNLTEEVKREAEEVFRRFGAYSQVDLSKILNPIIENTGTQSYGKIDLSRIPSAIAETEPNNDVVKYIKSIPVDIKTQSDETSCVSKNKSLLKTIFGHKKREV
ncbi:MAG: hypothetical protein IJO43_01815 [Bacilli bacterium]|nr:hypothetical protein [Bacilli bacterium]